MNKQLKTKLKNGRDVQTVFTVLCLMLLPFFVFVFCFLFFVSWIGSYEIGLREREKGGEGWRLRKRSHCDYASKSHSSTATFYPQSSLPSQPQSLPAHQFLFLQSVKVQTQITTAQNLHYAVFVRSSLGLNFLMSVGLKFQTLQRVARPGGTWLGL